MNLKSFIPAIIVTTLLTTSCSAIRSISGSNKSSAETARQNTAKATDKKNNEKFRGKRKHRNNTTAGSRATSANTVTIRPFTQDDSISIAKQLAGEWIFDIVAGITVTGDDKRPSLTFDENTNRFYAYNGCSYFNGDFSISSFNKLAFNNIISTLNLCDNIPWADYITAVWNVASHFYITSRGVEEYLDLRDSNDRTVATLKRHQLSDLNGMWNVVEINGSTIDSEQPTIVIDLLEQTVHGNTGCNLFNGDIYQSPDTDRSVQFLNMAVTRMACPNTAIETALLVALEQTEQAEVPSPDQAILADRSGRQLIRLQRSSL